MAGLLIGVSCATAALTALFLLSSERRRLDARLEQEASIQSAMFQTIVAQALSGSEEPEALQDLATRMAELPGVEWLEIFDDEGRVLAHSDPSRLGAPPRPEHAEFVRRVLERGEAVTLGADGDVRTWFAPVSTNGEPILGVVELVTSRRAVQTDLGRQGRNLLWILLLATFASCLALFSALDREVLRPVRRLLKQATELAAVGLDTPESGRGELGELDDVVTRALRALEARAGESEEKYRHLLEALPDGVAEVDASGRIVYSNPAYAAMHGYTVAEMTGKLIWDLPDAPEDRAQVRALALENLRATPPPIPYQTRNRGKDGRVVDIDVNWTYRFDETGAASGFTAIIANVTDRVRAERQLRESEERYRRVIENAPFCVFEIGARGDVLSANPSCLRLVGAESPRDVQGNPGQDFVVEEDRPRFDTALASARGGTPSELTCRTTLGRVIHSTLFSVPVPEGDAVRVLGINMDVTEAARARESLEASEARLRTVLDHMPVMLDAFDEEGNIVLWNRECERVTGYTAAEICDNPHALELLYPDAAERGPLEKVVREGEGDYRDWEWTLTCRKGEEKTVAWSNISARVPIPGWKSWGVGVDVTERVRAERALRESEEVLRSVTDSSPDYLAVVDLDHKVRFLNRGGLGFDREAVLGTSVWSYLPDDARSEFAACFARVLSAGSVQLLELDYPTPDGRLLPFEVRIGPVWRDGGVRQFALSATDVSERRRAEERYRRHFRSFPLASYSWRREGEDFVLDDFNDAAAEATQRGVAAFLGKTAREVYGEDSRIVEDLATVFRERTTLRRQFLHRFRTTGEPHHIDTSYTFVPPDSVIIHAEVIDERIAAEEALRRSEKSLAEAQHIAHLGNWDWDVVANELRWSDEVYRIFGRKPQEFEATYDAFLETVHPDDRPLVESAVDEALRGVKPYSITHRILRRDGEERFVHEQAEITLDVEGRPLRMTGIVQDVTRRHRALHQARKSLEEKETLLREIHHRVKNNLQVIASLLYLQSKKSSDENVVALFREMERRVETMALIHESIYQSPELGRVDFGQYVQRIVTGLGSAHRDAAVHIEVESRDALLNIDTAIPCGLIVNELVTNALRHAFRGRERGTIHVGFDATNGERRLLVRDDGLGLPGEIEIAGASTLGLKLVRSLTEQIGGRLEVRREGGTAFEISFQVRA